MRRWSDIVLLGTRALAECGLRLLRYLPWSRWLLKLGLGLVSWQIHGDSNQVGLASVRIYFPAPFHFCAQCVAPVTSLVLQAIIAVIIHIYWAFTLCVLQNVSLLFFSLNYHNRHMPFLVLRLPCSTVHLSPYHSILGGHMVQKGKAKKWPNLLQPLKK